MVSRILLTLRTKSTVGCLMAFENAIMNGHEGIVDIFLTSAYRGWMERPKIVIIYLHTCLQNAIESGQSVLVKLALKVMKVLQIDLAAKNNEALRLACYCSNNVDIVKLLLAYQELDIHFPIRPIYYGSSVVEQVLRHYPTRFSFTSRKYHNYSAIENAAAYGNLNILKYLLSLKQLDPRTTLVNNYLLLEVAGRGHADMVQFLLTNTNLDPTFEDSITLTVSCNFPNVVKILLDDGGVNPRCQQNKPLYMAAWELKNRDVVRLLLTFDSGRLGLTVDDVNEVWQKIWPAQSEKAERLSEPKRFYDLLLLLLDYCPSLIVDAAARFNQIFQLAAKVGDVETLRRVLTIEGVDPGADDNAALIGAVWRGQTESVRFLAGVKGVDAGARENEAIRVAAQKGNLEMVKILVATDGVDPMAKNGETVKRAKKYPEIVELLILKSRDC
ncbi:hypothetical protein HDU76_009478 [Blyttiomyces sp. JEL0837]|nr:hypothetical protein HDU76_009478 [Blyttiomyces sp. JEL0837]